MKVIKRNYHYYVFHAGKCIAIRAAWKTNMSEMVTFAFHYAQRHLI